jgi:hypothetical protein
LHGYSIKNPPPASQVYNGDEIGFDPNGQSPRVVSFRWTKNHYALGTGEKAPFWVTVFFMTRADGTVVIPPCIIHMGVCPGEDLSGIVDYNLSSFGPDLESDKYIPSDFLYWQNPAGYNDQAGFMQICKHFVQFAPRRSNDTPLFFFMDAHESHLNPDALQYLKDNNVFAFFLRANNSDVDQPNDNGPNSKLKSLFNHFLGLYNIKMSRAWKLSKPAFNYIFTQAWEEFQRTAGTVCYNAFVKTGIHPPNPDSPNNQVSHSLTPPPPIP